MLHLSRASPVPSSPANFGSSQPSQPFQFQPSGGTAGGGGFNFSAPSNGGFNNPFASNNGSASISDNDERRDPAGEPFGKRGRHVNGNDGDSVPLFAPMPSNPFGSTANGQQGGGGFSGFGQSNGMNGTQSQAATPAPIFSGFGQSQAAFNPTPTPQKAASFDFNFGAPAATAQPQSTSASFTFGQTQTPSQPKSTGFQFGSTAATSTPSSNLFGTSQAPSTNLFGSKPSTPALPATDLFGKKESSPAPSTNLFGSTSQAPAANLFGSTPAPSNPFGSRDASPAPTAPSTNLFGTQPSASSTFSSSVPAANNMFSQPASTPVQNPFASLNKPSAPTSFSTSGSTPNNLFGSRDPSPALSANGSTQPASVDQTPKPSASSLFGQQQQDTAPKPASTSLFGNTSQNSTSTMFGSPKPQTTSLFGNLGQTTNASSTPEKSSIQSSASNTLFGNTSKANNTELFGNLNKPVDKSVSDPQPNATPLFGATTTTSQSPTLFGQQTSSEVPSNSAPPSVSLPQTTQSSSIDMVQAPVNISQSQSTTTSPAKSLFSFGSASATPPPAPQPAKVSLFSSQPPLEPSASANDTPFTGPLSKNQISAQSSSVQQPTVSAINRSFEPGSIGESVERLRNSKPADKPTLDGTQYEELSIPRQIPDDLIKDLVPADFTEDQRKEFYCAYRIRALNKAMSNYFAGLQSAADPTNAIKFYNEQRKAFTDEIKSRKPKSLQTIARSDGAATKQSNATDGKRESSPTQPALSLAKTQAAPASSIFQSNGFSTVQPLNSASRPTSSLFATSVPNLPPPSSDTATPSKGKRKAEENLDQNNVDQHNKRPMRKIATPKVNGSHASPNTSNTANIFKDILDSPAKSPEKSPGKKTAALPTSSTISGDTTPKANPFGALFVPKSALKTDAAASPTPTLFTSKPAETPKTAGFTPPTSGLFGSKSADVTTSSPAKETSTFSGFKPAASTTAPTSTGGGFKMAGFTPGTAVNFASQFGKLKVKGDVMKATKLEPVLAAAKNPKAKL